MLKCFFFDRDGVLIKNYGYVHEIRKLKWLKGTIKAIKFLNKNKIKVIIITNQSGVARGYFSEKELLIFHKKMNQVLSKFKAKSKTKKDKSLSLKTTDNNVEKLHFKSCIINNVE